MKTYTILCSLIYLCAGKALAQFDGTIYQSMATPVANQPTFAGWHGGMNANISYTNQYPAIPLTNISQQISTDAYVHKLRSGFSLNFDHFRLGSGYIINNRISVGFSPKISIGDKLVIMPAVDVRLSSIRTEPNIFSYDIGPIYMTSYYRSKFLNAGIGGALVYQNTYLSVYIQDFTQSYAYALSDQNRKKYRMLSSQLYTIGHIFSAGKWRFTPTMNFTKTGDFNNLYLAMNSQYKWFYSGFRYHHNSDLSLAIGTEFKKAYRLSYSYNWSIARLGVQTGGAHEISVRALFLQKKAKKRFLENLPLF